MIKEHPDVSHIRISKLKVNFEECNTCKNIVARMAKALQRCDEVAYQRAKQEQVEHLALNKTSLSTAFSMQLSTTQISLRWVVHATVRYYYYGKREKARSGLCTSLILDKWDQKKCSQPWFVQPIKGAKMQQSCKQKVI